MKAVTGLISGTIFGVGLTVSQMVNPLKVMNFLDVFGNWDPSLAFVMIGALLVFGIGYFTLIKPRVEALNGEKMPIIGQGEIDKKLIVGASLFGIGWGITGVCPGPAIANFSSFNPDILIFIAVMIVGLLIGDRLKN